MASSLPSLVWWAACLLQMLTRSSPYSKCKAVSLPTSDRFIVLYTQVKSNRTELECELFLPISPHPVSHNNTEAFECGLCPNHLDKGTIILLLLHLHPFFR